jgi:hypothetical protein
MKLRLAAFPGSVTWLSADEGSWLGAWVLNPLCWPEGLALSADCDERSGRANVGFPIRAARPLLARLASRPDRRNGRGRVDF